ncbi:hypothetical protein QL285_080522 [Trifolium repens]|nr:hypothetical protein QL285_080522 [Trifolium repens]
MNSASKRGGFLISEPLQPQSSNPNLFSQHLTNIQQYHNKTHHRTIKNNITVPTGTPYQHRIQTEINPRITNPSQNNISVTT